MIRCKKAQSFHLADMNIFLEYYVRKNSIDGFTLLEMIVVMAIIAIMGAFIVIRVGGSFSNLKLRAAIRECSAVMRHAKSVAVSTQKEQKISFILKSDPEEKDYYTYHKVSRASRDTEEDISDEYEDEQGKKTELKREEKRKELDPVISLSWRTNPDSNWEDEGPYEISFSPRGFASGGEIRFALSDDSRFYIMKIDPVTGRVKTSTEEE